MSQWLSLWAVAPCVVSGAIPVEPAAQLRAVVPCVVEPVAQLWAAMPPIVAGVVPAEPVAQYVGCHAQCRNGPALWAR